MEKLQVTNAMHLLHTVAQEITSHHQGLLTPHFLCQILALTPTLLGLLQFFLQVADLSGTLLTLTLEEAVLLLHFLKHKLTWLESKQMLQQTMTSASVRVPNGTGGVSQEGMIHTFPLTTLYNETF